MDNNRGSRLLQMQARFQLRQKEQRLTTTHETQQNRVLTRLAASSVTRDLDDEGATTVHRQGKVRQMFEQRRSKAGIDKSYPLQPIHGNTNTERGGAPQQPHRIANGVAKEKNAERTKPAPRPAVNGFRKLKTDSPKNGSGDINHNTQPGSTPALSRTRNNNRYSEPRSQPSAPDSRDWPHNQVGSSDSIEDETFPHQLAPPPSAGSPPAPARGTKPTMEKKTAPAPKQTGRNIRAAGDSTIGDSYRTGRADRAEVSAGAASMLRSPQGKATTSTVQKTHATSGAGGNSDRSGGAPTANAAAGEPCSVCGRKFASERIQRHEDICRKTATKKRKPYDTLKHRLEGTEAQPFIKQVRKQSAPGKAVSSQPSKSSKPLNSTWRQKHEDFIRAIRAAKAAQAHVAAGGKLSDLPPPPPSENPDYVQCPHCQRRFNQAAAERHIPKCASFVFNKPKPSQPKKR